MESMWLNTRRVTELMIVVTKVMRCAAKVKLHTHKHNQKLSYLSFVPQVLQCESLYLSECRKNAFHCKTGVCIHKEALIDGKIDCLDGEDESNKFKSKQSKAQHIFTSTQF